MTGAPGEGREGAGGPPAPASPGPPVGWERGGVDPLPQLVRLAVGLGDPLRNPEPFSG